MQEFDVYLFTFLLTNIFLKLLKLVKDIAFKYKYLFQLLLNGANYFYLLEINQYGKVSFL